MLFRYETINHSSWVSPPEKKWLKYELVGRATVILFQQLECYLTLTIKTRIMKTNLIQKHEARMRRIWIFLILISVTHCGTRDQSTSPPEIGFPSDNNAPSESNAGPNNPVVSGEFSQPSPSTFNAPMVALRGLLSQTNTSQTNIP